MKPGCFLLCISMLLPAGARADDPDVAIHGFISQGALLTTDNNYLAYTKSGSLQFSEAGLNFTVQATDKLRLGAQLFGRNLGPLGDYKAVFDWYSLDYRWKDWLGFRAGRVKLPFGLYNDSSDIDAARTSILLPQSIYPVQNRDFLLAQSGGELYGYLNIGRAGGLDYRLYGGTIFLELTPQPASPITVTELHTPYVAGGRLLWSAPLDGLRLGGSAQFLRLDLSLLAPKPTSYDIPAALYVASIEYTHEDLLFAAEYSRWVVRSESSNQALFPNTHTTSERAYALASYRFTPLLQLGAYFSLYFPDREKVGRPDLLQDDSALTLRIDINRWWLLKLEGHYLHGTAALTSSMNDYQPLSALAPNWFLFAVKTTAYF